MSTELKNEVFINVDVDEMVVQGGDQIDLQCEVAIFTERELIVWEKDGQVRFYCLLHSAFL